LTYLNLEVSLREEALHVFLLKLEISQGGEQNDIEEVYSLLTSSS
jgi:hypothetical protein